MTNIQLTHDLSTVEGFTRRVAIDRTPRNIAVALISLSVLAIVYNVVSTLRTLGEFGGGASEFLLVFFSTNGDSEVTSIMFFVIVWAPLILLPASVIFFLYSRATAATVAAKTFAEFQAGGYLTTQSQTSMAVSPANDRNTQPVMLIGHPSVPDVELATLLSRVEAELAAIDKKTRKTLARSIVKAGVVKGIPASALSPQLPSPLLITLARKGSENVIVIPGATTRILGVTA